jgi:hypothetical protein
MIQGIIGSRITIRPTKRKVVKTVSTMENMAKETQKWTSSADIRLLAQKAAEKLGELKHKLAN